MMDQLNLDYQHWQLMTWAGGSLVTAVLGLGSYALWSKQRHKKQEARINQLFSISDLTNSLDLNRNGKRAGNSVDSLFIFPDISNYTHFVMSKHLSVEQAQDVIFALMSSIIKAAGKTLKFSKMEGDSALFFADAETLSPKNAGETISLIFDSFDRQKENILKELQADPLAQTLVKQLDLKIIIHRGMAQRFTYRGTIDHFGAEVTALHKLLKNDISAKRYVLVTDAASACVELDAEPWGAGSVDEFSEAGLVRGRVFLSAKANKVLNTNQPFTPGDPAIRTLNNQKWISTMKIKTIFSAMIVAVVATTAFATEYTKGTVKKIDAKSGKITVKHEELKNLGMPAMTMVFVPKDDAVLGKLKEGKNIEFVAERVKGKLTLVEVK